LQVKKWIFFQRVQFLNLQEIEFIQKEEDSLEEDNCHHHHHHHHNHLYTKKKKKKKKSINVQGNKQKKKRMSMFKMQPTLLVFRWLLEVDARSSRKSHKSLREKENNLKTTKA
jgi:hypothetical protein